MIEFVPNMDSSMGDPGIINRSPLDSALPMIPFQYTVISICVVTCITGCGKSANDKLNAASTSAPSLSFLLHA